MFFAVMFKCFDKKEKFAKGQSQAPGTASQQGESHKPENIAILVASV